MDTEPIDARCSVGKFYSWRVLKITVVEITAENVLPNNKLPFVRKSGRENCFRLKSANYSNECGRTCFNFGLYLGSIFIRRYGYEAKNCFGLD